MNRSMIVRSLEYVRTDENLLAYLMVRLLGYIYPRDCTRNNEYLGEGLYPLFTRTIRILAANRLNNFQGSTNLWLNTNRV